MAELKATPEQDLKPHLVWLGRFLGMDVYMDVQRIGIGRNSELAQRLFKKLTGNHN